MASRCTSSSRRCPTSRAATGPQDEPRLGDDRGPTCLHLPNPPWNQSNPVRRQPNFDDGVDEPLGKGTSRAATAYDAASQLGGFGGYAGSPEESDLLAALLAPGLGTTAAEVPDLGGLLVGPMVRGATVSLGEGGGTP